MPWPTQERVPLVRTESAVSPCLGQACSGVLTELHPPLGIRVRETVEELRLQMVSPDSHVAAALDAMRRAHPYEEPAVDITTLLPQPQPNTGAGRVVKLEKSKKDIFILSNL